MQTDNHQPNKQKSRVSLLIRLLLFIVAFIVIGSGVFLYVAISAAGTIRAKAELRAITFEYLSYSHVYHKTPSSIGDLMKSPTYQLNAENKYLRKAIEKLESGEFILIWNATLDPNPAKNDEYVLGYEKSVTETSGVVSMASGSVDHFTKSAFESLPKISTQ
jgi:hypothetical protein